MKSEDSYVKDYNLNVVLLSSNTNLVIFCICIVAYDFVTLKRTNPTTKKQTKEVWVIPKIYCFMTYYPFFKFFLDMITLISSIIFSNRYNNIYLNNTKKIC